MSNINKAWNRWKDITIITLLVRGMLLSIGVILNPKTFNIFEPWVRWDGPHYLDIAKNWYQSTGDQSLWIVFYPLYPITIKTLSFFIIDFSAAAIIVSIIFSFLAAIFLYELVLLDYDKEIAFRSVWFLNIFPTAYFLQASYSESIYLALSLATIYFFRRNSLFKSVILGILAAATRVNGLLLLPLLLLESRKIKQIISLPFILFGFFFYLSINFFTFGDFFYFTKPLVVNWHKQLDFPWSGVVSLFHTMSSPGGQFYLTYLTEFISLIMIFLIGIYTLFKIRISYAAYVFINLLLFTSTSFIISTPRYSLILFPLYITFAKISNRYILLMISTFSLILLIFFTSLYVQGKWTF